MTNPLETPEFKKLSDAFGKFTDKHSNDNLGARAARIAAAAYKAEIDQALVEFPKAYIEATLQDISTLIVSPEMAAGISATVRSLDAAKVEELVDNLKLSITTPEASLQIAKALKQSLSKVSNEALAEQLDSAAALFGEEKQMKFGAIYSFMVEPLLNQIRVADEAQTAELVTQLAGMIPSSKIAAQVDALTSQVTPAAVSQAAQQLVASLRSPKDIAETVHAVGGAASTTLGEAVKCSTSGEIIDKLKLFVENAMTIISPTAKTPWPGRKPRGYEGFNY